MPFQCLSALSLCCDLREGLNVTRNYSKFQCLSALSLCCDRTCRRGSSGHSRVSMPIGIIPVLRHGNKWQARPIAGHSVSMPIGIIPVLRLDRGRGPSDVPTPFQCLSALSLCCDPEWRSVGAGLDAVSMPIGIIPVLRRYRGPGGPCAIYSVSMPIGIIPVLRPISVSDNHAQRLTVSMPIGIIPVLRHKGPCLDGRGMTVSMPIGIIPVLRPSVGRDDEAARGRRFNAYRHYPCVATIDICIRRPIALLFQCLSALSLCCDAITGYPIPTFAGISMPIGIIPVLRRLSGSR